MEEKEKQKYEIPEMEIIDLGKENIIICSGDDDEGEDGTKIGG